MATTLLYSSRPSIPQAPLRQQGFRKSFGSQPGFSPNGNSRNLFTIGYASRSQANEHRDQTNARAQSVSPDQAIITDVRKPAPTGYTNCQPPQADERRDQVNARAQSVSPDQAIITDCQPAPVNERRDQVNARAESDSPDQPIITFVRKLVPTSDADRQPATANECRDQMDVCEQASSPDQPTTNPHRPAPTSDTNCQLDSQHDVDVVTPETESQSSSKVSNLCPENKVVATPESQSSSKVSYSCTENKNRQKQAKPVLAASWARLASGDSICSGSVSLPIQHVGSKVSNTCFFHDEMNARAISPDQAEITHVRRLVPTSCTSHRHAPVNERRDQVNARAQSVSPVRWPVPSYTNCQPAPVNGRRAQVNAPAQSVSPDQAIITDFRRPVPTGYTNCQPAPVNERRAQVNASAQFVSPDQAIITDVRRPVPTSYTNCQPAPVNERRDQINARAQSVSPVRRPVPTSYTNCQPAPVNERRDRVNARAQSVSPDQAIITDVCRPAPTSYTNCQPAPVNERRAQVNARAQSVSPDQATITDVCRPVPTSYTHCRLAPVNECLGRKDDRAQFVRLSCCPKMGGHQSSLKLAVFDFDCTLTSAHVFASLAGVVDSECPKLPVPPPYAKTEQKQLSRLCQLDVSWGPCVFALAAFGGERRVSRLRSALKELNDSNVECVIVSRGLIGPITKCLEQVFLLPFFTRIVGNIGSAFGGSDGDRTIPPCPSAEMRLLGNPHADFGGACGRNKSEHIRRFMEERKLVLQQVVFMDDEIGHINAAQFTCRTIHVASRFGAQEQEFQLLRSMMSDSAP